MKKIITTLTTIILCIIILKKLLNNLTKKIILVPSKKDENEYNKYLNDENIIHETLITDDNIKLSACLYNTNKIPDYNDNIILFSHGNSGILSKVIYIDTVKELSKYGSLFIYDYRGYGDSSGELSFDGLFNDVLCVWNFLTKIKNINANRITLFGHSLGTTISTHLLKQLIETKQIYPTKLILQNPFYCIKRLANEYSSILSHFVIAPYNTYKFFNYIDKNVTNINIIIIHSRDDELINNNHSKDLQKLIKNNKCSLFLTEGTHNKPIYNEDIYKSLTELINKNIEINNVKTL